jgi:hypothetical protein
VDCFFSFTESCRGEVSKADGAADSPWSVLAVVASELGYCEEHRERTTHSAIEQSLKHR